MYHSHSRPKCTEQNKWEKWNQAQLASQNNNAQCISPSIKSSWDGLAVCVDVYQRASLDWGCTRVMQRAVTMTDASWKAPPSFSLLEESIKICEAFSKGTDRTTKCLRRVGWRVSVEIMSRQLVDKWIFSWSNGGYLHISLLMRCSRVAFRP